MTIHASGRRNVPIVWAFPGTESKPIERVEVGEVNLSIEMQRGGHIRVEAAYIDMPSGADRHT